MAQITEVRLVDDLNQGKADETVDFGLDGKRYEIDLCTANAEKLRAALADYVAAARRGNANTAGTPSKKSSGSNASVTNLADRKKNAEIRQWAQARGMKVSERGRIPADVLEAWADRDNTPEKNIRPADSSGHSRDECDNLDECPTHRTDTPAPAAESPAPEFADGSDTDATPEPETASQEPEPTSVEEFNQRVLAWHKSEGWTGKYTKVNGEPNKAAVDRYLAAQQTAGEGQAQTA